LSIWHDKVVAIRVIISSVAQIILVIVFIVLALGCRLRVVKVFFVKRPDPVGSDLRVIDLNNCIRRQRAKSHR
jgi:hypothetical protein